MTKKEKTKQYIDTKSDLDFYLKHYEENPGDYAQKIVKMVQANLISIKINDGMMARWKRLVMMKLLM